MPATATRRLLRTAAGLAIVALLDFSGLMSGASAGEHDIVRGLWVVRTALTSPSAIDAMVEAARVGQFDTLLVQVRGRGDAYYLGGLEPRSSALGGQPMSFDPLAETIRRAHAQGLRVHAWINLNLVAGVAEPPTARGHVIHQRPEWLMVPRALASEVGRIDPKRPEYLERLVRYTRTRSDLEGLYLSPLPLGAADYTTGVVRDIVQRYPVDGVHLDYVRYPGSDFDFSPEALGAFRASLAPDLAPEEQRQYDAQRARDPLVYVDAFPERWQSFRQAQLTRLVVKIRDAVKAARPSAVLTAAVVPDLAEAARRMQDWPGWLARGLVDAVCAMAYTTDGAQFEAQLAAARTVADPRSIWAGIGAYRLSQDQIVTNVQTAQRMGLGGVVLFSYDSLTNAPGGSAYLIATGHAAFGERR